MVRNYLKSVDLLFLVDTDLFYFNYFSFYDLLWVESEDHNPVTFFEGMSWLPLVVVGEENRLFKTLHKKCFSINAYLDAYQASIVWFYFVARDMTLFYRFSYLIVWD